MPNCEGIFFVCSYMLGCPGSPFPVIVTTRIISCLVGDSYKPSFATITGKGGNPHTNKRGSGILKNLPYFYIEYMSELIEKYMLKTRHFFPQ